MAEAADVVIVGGGIVGSSIAYRLAEAGCTDVLVLEREPHQGRGSTGKSMGGVRAQFSTEINIRLSLYSLDFFARFEEATGCPAGYRQQGYLFVASSEEHLAYLQNNYQLLVACGVHSLELLSPADVLRIMPHLRADDILGGSFCSTDGFVDPYSVMTGFTLRAVEMGARLWKGVEATGILEDARGVAGVETTRGRVATRTVVNAAGPWAAQVAALAGVELPVHPLRRMLVPTEPFPLDLARGADGGRHGHGFPLPPRRTGNPARLERSGRDAGIQDQFRPGVHRRKTLLRAVDRVPCFDALEVNPKRAWAGLYAMGPDHYPILGPVPQVAGLYLANGFSGHGVMHSPATGKIVADLILHGHSALIDAGALSLARFAEGRLLHETAVL